MALHAGGWWRGGDVQVVRRHRLARPQQGPVRRCECFDDAVALRVEDRELGSFRQRRGAHGSQLRRARPYQCARGEGEEAWCHALCLAAAGAGSAAAEAMDSGLLTDSAVLKLS